MWNSEHQSPDSSCPVPLKQVSTEPKYKAASKQRGVEGKLQKQRGVEAKVQIHVSCSAACTDRVQSTK